MSRPDSRRSTSAHSGGSLTQNAVDIDSRHDSGNSRIVSLNHSRTWDSREFECNDLSSVRFTGYRQSLATGNEAFRNAQFAVATKQYRICLDSIPLDNSLYRKKVYRNLGHSLMKQGDYLGASRAYEQSGMDETAVVVNFLVCVLITGDKALAKKQYVHLISICSDKAIVKKVSKLMIRALGDSTWISSSLESTHPEIKKWLEARDCVDTFNLAENVDKQISRIKEGGRSTSAAFLYLALDREDEAAVLSCEQEYDGNCRVNLGVSFLKTNRVESAICEFREAIKLNSNECWQALYNLGISIRGVEGLNYAAKVKNELGLSLLADLYEEMGEFKLAADTLLLLLSSGGHKNDPHALARLGVLWDTKFGDQGKARKYFAEAFHIDPSKIFCGEWLAAYYVAEGLYEAGVDVLLHLIQLRKDRKYISALSNCYRNLGDIKSSSDLQTLSNV